MVTLLKGVFLEATDSSTKTVEDSFVLMLRITQELAHMKHLAQDLAQSKCSRHLAVVIIIPPKIIA